jgi:hypothetical protein
MQVDAQVMRELEGQSGEWYERRKASVMQRLAAAE